MHSPADMAAVLFSQFVVLARTYSITTAHDEDASTVVSTFERDGVVLDHRSTRYLQRGRAMRDTMPIVWAQHRVMVALFVSGRITSASRRDPSSGRASPSGPSLSA